MITGIFVEGNDVTRHVESEEFVRLANMELKHRGKNMLTMVNVIASRTFGSSEKLSEFQNRILTLDKAQDLLTNRQQNSASVRDVLAAALGPHLGAEARIDLTGPQVLLGPRQAVALSLATYELATNAMKYGALSNDIGRIAITWNLEDSGGEKAFQLAWKETGGPTVAQRQRNGFGTTILTRFLGPEFGGTVDLRLDPEGLSLSLKAPENGWIVSEAPSIPPVSG